jgi:coenzyme F420-reducing hydrogenase alpha subunit
MSELRRISVKALTRVEGEGALRIRVRDGTIEIAEFNIYEPPRFFERLLRGRAFAEVPDITARICGICPVAYQLTACQALENAFGVQITPAIAALRRLLYWGEWIQSHSLHIHLLHAPDFLGYESGFSLAVDRPEFVERGLRFKAIGSRIMEVVGGRAVHPINVAVGGFFKAPAAAALRGLIPDLEWGLAAALELVRDVSQFEFPSLQCPATCVALRSDTGSPSDSGRIISSAGLDIAIDEFEQHFAEEQVPHSTALYSLQLPDRTPYLVGPVARLNLCREQLPPHTRRSVEACGIDWPLVNPYKSIVARALEVAAAFEESLGIVRDVMADINPCRVEVTPREGTGCAATEAPRGLLYHRYSVTADGLITAATIIPPTSQNQAQIEKDLRGLLPSVLGFADALVSSRCEQLIRSYDPCISCATHFLTLVLDRGEA